MLKFDAPDIHTASSREWIVTNGIGGFASSTICFANTRRYHGLLVAAMHPPTDRMVLCSRLDEQILIQGKTYDIASNFYPGTVHPTGYEWLSAFEKEPLPKAIFSGEDFNLSKTVFMLHSRNITVIEYVNHGSEMIQLKINPLISCRDYHGLSKKESDINFHIECFSEHVVVKRLKEHLPISIYFDKGQFAEAKDWYYDVVYPAETERGLDDQEDLFCIGYLVASLEPEEKLFVVLSAESSLPEGSPEEWKQSEILRLREAGQVFEDSFLNDLAISGDQFLVWRKSSSGFSLIAGYPWFTDWGRDTMIAMRGLLIATGRKKEAESVFRTFFHHLQDGLIPNRFPDEGQEPEYNTIDATLWLFVALYEYFEKFEDLDYISGIFPHLTEILDSHQRGTLFNIQVTSEGLLYGGHPDIQLTWMDAKVGDHTVTPRHGCAVEINALWYNALRIWIFFGEKLGCDVRQRETAATLTELSFRKTFWHEQGYLYDVVLPGNHKDASIRPNQIYAVSLPFSPLDHEQQIQVVSTVHDHLYTPYGLRSLSPADPHYRSSFTGDQWARDHAYHQGTVWTHLWGEYALAYLKINNYSLESRQQIISMSNVLEQHFYKEACIKGVSEIFEGDAPHAPKGCFHQAWAVGMTLLALVKSYGRFGSAQRP